MDLATIEIIAKKTAMATGVDQNVLTRKGGGYSIQPKDAPVPADAKVQSTMIAGIDLTGIAGPPTISGPVR